MVIAITVGTVLGFLTGLSIGGGSLLILWLTFVLGTDPVEAKVINLLFFLPAALIASLFRWKQKSLNFRIILPAVIAGSLGALSVTWLANQLNIEILKKIFGIVLTIAGLRELFTKQK